MEISTKIARAVSNTFNATTEKSNGRKFLQSIMLVLVLVSISLFTSCIVGPPPRIGHVRSVEINTSNDNQGHHGREHHDNGRHRGHRD